jgi:hypothetical protein
MNAKSATYTLLEEVIESEIDFLSPTDRLRTNGYIKFLQVQQLWEIEHSNATLLIESCPDKYQSSLVSLPHK